MNMAMNAFLNERISQQEHKTEAEAEEEEGAIAAPVERIIPDYGTVEWLQYCSELDGHLPTPIDISITGSIYNYDVPELKWYNFDVYPQKIKVTNTGYTVVVGAKWKAERPYIEGGPLLEKHILSQIHFHWGNTMMEGSDHVVDQRRYPGEMQVTYFRAEYMTQEEAFKHPDGVCMVCYIIKYGMSPDERLEKFIEGFPRIQEAQTHTKIGPYPMSQLMPCFAEDYFFYWGTLKSVNDEAYVIRWIVPRSTLFATVDQMKEFRKLMNPWDEPLLRNFRPIQEREGRRLFLFKPHWCLYNSLLPIPSHPDPPVTVLSPVYLNHPELLPKENAYMLEPPVEPEETTEATDGTDAQSSNKSQTSRLT